MSAPLRQPPGAGVHLLPRGDLVMRWFVDRLCDLARPPDDVRLVARDGRRRTGLVIVHDDVPVVMLTLASPAPSEPSTV